MAMLQITPQIMEGAYELLLLCPPFKNWKLPPADEVEFHVMHARDRAADCCMKADGTYVIRVNRLWGGTLPWLLFKMAHEMCHMQHELTCPGDQAHHGKRFNSVARVVCRIHGWDFRTF